MPVPVLLAALTLASAAPGNAPSVEPAAPSVDPAAPSVEPPASVAPTAPPPLALTISGGATLGVHEAGYLYLLTEALRRADAPPGSRSPPARRRAA